MHGMINKSHMRCWIVVVLLFCFSEVHSQNTFKMLPLEIEFKSAPETRTIKPDEAMCIKLPTEFRAIGLDLNLGESKSITIGVVDYDGNGSYDDHGVDRVFVIDYGARMVYPHFEEDINPSQYEEKYNVNYYSDSLYLSIDQEDYLAKFTFEDSVANVEFFNISETSQGPVDLKYTTYFPLDEFYETIRGSRLKLTIPDDKEYLLLVFWCTSSRGYESLRRFVEDDLSKVDNVQVMGVYTNFFDPLKLRYLDIYDDTKRLFANSIVLTKEQYKYLGMRYRHPDFILIDKSGKMLSKGARNEELIAIVSGKQM